MCFKQFLSYDFYFDNALLSKVGDRICSDFGIAAFYVKSLQYQSI